MILKIELLMANLLQYSREGYFQLQSYIDTLRDNTIEFIDNIIENIKVITYKLLHQQGNNQRSINNDSKIKALLADIELLKTQKILIGNIILFIKI